MITYKEQEGAELGESQAQEEYYNSQEEGLVGAENVYGYEGQQADNYYMDQQQYGENLEGMELGEYYQQDQEYMQGQEYQDNQYEGLSTRTNGGRTKKC